MVFGTFSVDINKHKRLFTLPNNSGNRRNLSVSILFAAVVTGEKLQDHTLTVTSTGTSDQAFW